MSIIDYLFKKNVVPQHVEVYIIIIYLFIFTVFFFFYLLYIGVDMVLELSEKRKSLSPKIIVTSIIGITSVLLIIPDLIFGKILELYYSINDEAKSYREIFVYMIENHFNFTMNLDKDDVLNNSFGKFFLYLHFIGSKIMELAIIALLISSIRLPKANDNSSKQHQNKS